MSERKVSLFRRSNGVWYALFVEEGQPRKWKSTGCTVEAKALASLSTIKLDTPRVHSSAKSRLIDFTSEFLEYAKHNFAPGTVVIYASALRTLLQVSGNIRLEDISHKHIEKFKVFRSVKAKPITVNIDLRTLRAAFNTAVKWNYLPTNPLKNCRMLRVEESIPVIFTKDDLRRLLDAISDDWLREIVMTSILTGMRRGEVVNLPWKDVDLPRRLIHIQSNETYRTKQGRRHSIPMSDDVYDLLSEKKREQCGDFVFTNKGLQINASLVSHKIKDIMRKIGLDDDTKLDFHRENIELTDASGLSGIFSASFSTASSKPTKSEITCHCLSNMKKFIADFASKKRNAVEEVKKAMLRSVFRK